ncbi:D-aminoacyl-tRNA deacylase [Viridibacterium curvum]|uniref:D-aminoacyl-tRNA deacylase n=1 Tax=Viridibacterium curvum TaxID=1101404 RepID=A0ABP9QB50_9RHOO
MIALIQRVSEAAVRVDDQIVGQIGQGVLAFVGIQKGDDAQRAERLLERILGYRIFYDDAGRMNCSLRDVRGGLLLVSQFTLAADTQRGTRPSFSTAAAPDEARALFDAFTGLARNKHDNVATGVFGADMKVRLVNDGPVTFWLEV